MCKYKSNFRLVSPSVASGSEAMAEFYGKTSTDVKHRGNWRVKALEDGRGSWRWSGVAVLDDPLADGYKRFLREG
jgi:hypothetical protein